MQLDLYTPIAISNALRILAGLKTAENFNLLRCSIAHLYIYSIMTTAFLEGVIWQLTVSAPSARQRGGGNQKSDEILRKNQKIENLKNFQRGKFYFVATPQTL